ncbi:uncharacterized protein METZ01_LOCUS284055 [marine metagenome]|uniref:Uncharacterized protein n=1 Tax=marine metagenome TaxID=408172 RepID=A0A382L8H4_9ZZZZ
MLGFIFLGIFLIIGVIVVIFKMTNKSDELHKITNCKKEAGPNNYYVIILDNTDTLRPIQKSSIKKKIKVIINEADPNDKVIIYSLSNFSVEKTVPLIDICSMPDGSDANELYQNKAFMRKHKSKLFDAPIEDAVNKMIAVDKGSNTSPIIELIQKIRIQNLPDKIGNKKVEIHLFSDLLQYSENFSFYDKNYNLKKFLKSLEFEIIKSDLSGIEVTIWQLINSRIDNIRLRDHWKEIFTNMNTKYRPTIEPISG